MDLYNFIIVVCIKNHIKWDFPFILRLWIIGSTFFCIGKNLIYFLWKFSIYDETQNAKKKTFKFSFSIFFLLNIEYHFYKVSMLKFNINSVKIEIDMKLTCMFNAVSFTITIYDTRDKK